MMRKTNALNLMKLRNNKRNINHKCNSLWPKVGRQNALRAVPLLKVGRLEPSHGDTFRRHCSPSCKIRVSVFTILVTLSMRILLITCSANSAPILLLPFIEPSRRLRPLATKPSIGASGIRNLHSVQCLYSSRLTKNCKQNSHGRKSAAVALLLVHEQPSRCRRSASALQCCVYRFPD